MGNLIRGIFLVTLVNLMTAQLAFSQSLEEQRLQSASKYNYLNDLSFSSNPQTNATDQLRNVTYTLGLKYKLDKKTSLWAFGRLNKSLNGRETLGLLDAILRYERSVQKIYGFNNRVRVSAILPSNERIHEQTSFQGGASFQFRSGRSVGSKAYLQFINTFRWNLHEFSVSETANPNIQGSLSTLVNLSYNLSSKVLLSGSIGWSMAKTYRETYRDRYTLDLSANYTLTKEAALYAGFTTNADPISPNGQSTNLSVFDERDTTYYMGLSHFF